MRWVTTPAGCRLWATVQAARCGGAQRRAEGPGCNGAGAASAGSLEAWPADAGC